MAYNEPSGVRATQGGGSTLSSYFKPAKSTLEEMIQLFRQGGGYGAGQNAIIDTQANQAQAKAASDAVASGMSSGSLATSTGNRISRDTATAKLGVEDTRTNMLAQAMQALSQMFTQFGGMSSQENMAKNQLQANKQNQLNDALSRVVAGRTPDRGAGGGLSSTSETPWYNPWGPTVPGDPNYNLGRNQPQV